MNLNARSLVCLAAVALTACGGSVDDPSPEPSQVAAGPALVATAAAAALAPHTTPDPVVGPWYAVDAGWPVQVTDAGVVIDPTDAEPILHTTAVGQACPQGTIGAPYLTEPPYGLQFVDRHELGAFDAGLALTACRAWAAAATASPTGQAGQAAGLGQGSPCADDAARGAVCGTVWLLVDGAPLAANGCWQYSPAGAQIGKMCLEYAPAAGECTYAPSDSTGGCPLWQ